MIIALIDLETTGLDGNTDEIIEIGCIVFESRTMEILDTIDIKVKPEHIETASPRALEVNGYTEEAWADAMSLHQAMLLLAEKVQGATLMAYNVTFDWSFLKTAFETTGIENPMHYHRLDLLSMAWAIIPHHKVGGWALKTVCVYLGLKPEPKVHRAIHGCEASLEVYKKLMS